MNKRQYIERLLSLCTDKQKELFNRMYLDISAVPSDKLSWATTQLENTLKNLNNTRAEVNSIKKESDQKIKDLTTEISKLQNTIVNLENELKEAYANISQLNNPIDVNNSQVQDDVRLLRALEMCGVDNWDGYGEAVEMMRELQPYK